MAQEIVVKLIVDDGQVEQATKDIQKLGGSIEKVETTSKKAGANIGESLDGATEASGNLQGGIEGAINQVVVLGKAAKTSGKAMRSALISTGIGALVIAVGLLVENWEAIGKAIGLINPSIEEQLEVLKEIDKSTQIRVDLLDKEINLATKQGKATEQLQKQRINLVKILQQQKKEQLLLLESEAEELKTSALTLTTRQKIVKAIMNANIAGSGDLYIIKQQEEASTRYKAIQDLIVKSKIEQVDLETKLFDLQNPDGLRPARDPLRTATTDIEAEGVQTMAIVRADVEQQVTDNLAEQAAQRRLIRQAELESEQAQNDVRLDSAHRLAKGLMALGEESKAAAIAGIIISQVAGAAEAIQSNVIANAKAVAAFPLTAGQPWVTINTASTVLGIAAGALAAKAISEIGGGGSPGSVGQVPGGASAPQAPSFNVVGTGGVSQLAQSLQAQDTPVRAYVVSGDVTSSQEFDRNVENSSSIG